jgi:hypothetical protein
MGVGGISIYPTRVRIKAIGKFPLAAPRSFKSYIAISNSTPEKFQKNTKVPSMLEVAYGRKIAITDNFLLCCFSCFINSYNISIGNIHDGVRHKGG